MNYKYIYVNINILKEECQKMKFILNNFLNKNQNQNE